MREASMNLDKNRDTEPLGLNRAITLETLIRAREEDDLDSNRAVEITGFVARVEQGTEKEMCNCANKKRGILWSLIFPHSTQVNAHASCSGNNASCSRKV